MSSKGETSAQDSKRGVRKKKKSKNGKTTWLGAGKKMKKKWEKVRAGSVTAIYVHLVSEENTG